MMDQRQPFVNVFTISHPLWAIVQDIQDVRSAARIEAIQTITFVDDVGMWRFKPTILCLRIPIGLIGFLRMTLKAHIIPRKRQKPKWALNILNCAQLLLVFCFSLR